MPEENGHWRPEWKRKQKRTTKNIPAPDIDNTGPFKPDEPVTIIDLSAINPQSALSVLTALVQYLEDNPRKMLPSDFFIDAKLPESILDDLQEDITNSVSLKRLKQRAREICENRIVNCALRSHTNPATTIFLLKNKFGYVDRTESKSDVTTSGKIEIIMHIPMPPFPPKMVSDPQQVVFSDSENSSKAITPLLST